MVLTLCFNLMTDLCSLKFSINPFPLQQVRDLDLEREEKRQQQHDELRRAYAVQANSFQDWLQVS